MRLVVILQIAKWLVALALAMWMTVPTAIVYLLWAVLLDFATGVARAFMHGKLNSSVGMKGFVKKALLIVLVLAAHYIERFSGLEVHVESFLCTYFIVVEAISIIENCARAGVPIPPFVVDALIKAQQIYPPPMSAEEVEAAFNKARVKGQSKELLKSE